MWDRSAPGYDRQMAFFERVWFAGGREWLAERAQGRVLLVGVGTGRDLEHVAPGVEVSGIDLSPQMLALARRRAADLGRAVDLREGDASRLPWGPCSFDTVVVTLCLCSVPDPRGALTEAHRVLVPGGRLLLLDHVASSAGPLRALQWLLERATVPLAGEHFTRRQLPLVRDVGFEVVEAERSKAGTVERVHAVRPG